MRILLGMLALGLLVAVATPYVAFGDQTRWYASSGLAVSNVTGIRAQIATADPNIHDNMSLEAIWLEGPGNNDWIEVGWLKGAGVPTHYSYCSPNTECEPYVESGFGWHGEADIGQLHSYQIQHHSGNEWRVYIDGSLKRTITDAGFSAGNNIRIGGEVDDPENDIGVSGLLNVKYEINDDGNWRLFNGVERADLNYWIVEIYGEQNDMQNGTCWHQPEYC